MPDRPPDMGDLADFGVVRLVIPAEPMAVRQALEQLFATVPPGLLPEDLRMSAEIVIAEVLNNIVEHAYAGSSGDIDLSVQPLHGGLRCSVTDHGAPMPDHRLPGGALPAWQPDDLPEGGFGWFMIQALAQDIRYDRIGATNRLTFWLPAEG
ncbi:ATP-binding protein [Gemmobacter sp.]|uniref:ATP-binding protein n=1 Tax=Gemmobacter sp. TaxID=1898957 RepID=UPI002AFE2588|nr:ATP-binding protein [Gemmobacter sp.]